RMVPPGALSFSAMGLGPSAGGAGGGVSRFGVWGLRLGGGEEGRGGGAAVRSGAVGPPLVAPERSQKNHAKKATRTARRRKKRFMRTEKNAARAPRLQKKGPIE